MHLCMIRVVNGSELTVKDRIGMRVWIQDAPGVAKNIVGATGTVQSVTGSGRVLVIFDPDDEIRRRLNMRGVYIVPAALTCVNPFLK